MKKLLSLIFMSILALSLVGCNSEADKKEAEKVANYKKSMQNDVKLDGVEFAAPKNK